MDLIDRDAVLHNVSTECSNAYEAKYCEAQIALTRAKRIIRSAPAVNRWIPCSERLPEREKDVLVFYPRWHDDMFSESGIVVAQLMYDGLTWDICGEFNPGLHAISHWMPLPEPPKEDET